ncbi:unnamed protein product [Nippostrongylus brasiliensis]|uniref:Soluble calcium-activated nucleotidase 1 (inferred by orthology to a human protein) n=1 Tax=Nippostrongylus brasiliensis TaxID=27835 RepID=A0A0N4YJX2_NIPBR|nr:unnamed protein product [Nippostrongylus brasiliensis]
MPTDVHKRSAGVEYDLTAITDMDRDAETSKGSWTWRAVTREGKLLYNPNDNSASVTWTPNSDKNVTTHFNYKGRGMELSDLTDFNGHVLSPDDKTGMIYEIKEDKAIPWIFLNSGPGNTTSGMKAEWMTKKGGKLYVGGHGMEYRNKEGKVFTTDPLWIKVVSPNGAVEHIDWTDNYDKLRKEAGYPSPGYLTHESAQWSDIHQKWFFLPRKANPKAYVEEEDEVSCTNLLITASEDFEEIKVVKIGGEAKFNPLRGYSAFEFIPDTDDSVIVAIKSKEVNNKRIRSYVTVFKTDGEILLEDQKLEDELKFEGLFLHRK